MDSRAKLRIREDGKNRSKNAPLKRCFAESHCIFASFRVIPDDKKLKIHSVICRHVLSIRARTAFAQCHGVNATHTSESKVSEKQTTKQLLKGASLNRNCKRERSR